MGDQIRAEDLGALRDLVDRQAVAELVDRYFASVDDGTGLDGAWAATIFSEDVRIEHRGFTLEGLEDVVVGHRFVRGGWARTFHASTNLRVALDGDRARIDGRLQAIHVHREGGPAEPYVIANAFDGDVVRTAGGWRIQRLAQHTIWSSGRSHLDLTSEGA